MRPRCPTWLDFSSYDDPDLAGPPAPAPTHPAVAGPGRLVLRPPGACHACAWHRGLQGPFQRWRRLVLAWAGRHALRRADGALGRAPALARAAAWHRFDRALRPIAADARDRD